MPAAEYEHRTDSVLAWKKAQKLGRFDPNAPSIEQQKIRASEREVEERGKRNRLLCSSRATYSYDSGGCVLGEREKKQFWNQLTIAGIALVQLTPTPLFLHA